MTEPAADQSLRILLTGAGGQLGLAVQRLATRRGIQLASLGRGQLDITDRNQVMAAVRRHRPTHIINAAAYTAVDRAESEAEQAYAVNRDGAAAVARAAQAHGVRLLHVSTDFVFDGEQSRPYKPDDTPNPINVYGASKWAGEQAVMDATHGEALILRTARVYSLDGGNFLNTMLRLMNERDALSVVEDQIGTPSHTEGIADVLIKAAGKNLTGTYHWTDAGAVSWYDFAVAIYEQGRAQGVIEGQVTISPIPSAEFPTPARRPPNSVLDKSAIRHALGLTGQHWRTALKTVLAQTGNR